MFTNTKQFLVVIVCLITCACGPQSIIGAPDATICIQDETFSPAQNGLILDAA